MIDYVPNVVCMRRGGGGRGGGGGQFASYPSPSFRCVEFAVKHVILLPNRSFLPHRLTFLTPPSTPSTPLHRNTTSSALLFLRRGRRVVAAALTGGTAT
jgi:hypothetical protein